MSEKKLTQQEADSIRLAEYNKWAAQRGKGGIPEGVRPDDFDAIFGGGPDFNRLRPVPPARGQMMKALGPSKHK